MLYRKPKSAYLQKVEKAYLTVRTKEGRVYTDDQVLQLPNISKSHHQYKEWLIRKDSLYKILTVLNKQPQVKRILDLGCGNGWMCNALNKNGFEVVGMDINQLELEQAARLFPQCTFYERDILEDNSDLNPFDAIIISAAFQYFKEPQQLIEKLKNNLLNKDGFILIADTKFYTSMEFEAAQLRTEHYYHQMEVSEMIEHYYHHNVNILTKINARIVRNSSIFGTIFNRITGIKNPFNLYKISQDF
ncbi:MAG: hypothetical protein RIR48_1300 [Bacteroidota bacterium]|jgi:2-polyprenyl-3-methyl-5-hydroxy-6-metoxy-1,4-benzoquinol methylase